MKRTSAIALALATFLTPGVVNAALPDEVQAPRGDQEIQAPRGDQDVQAPRS